MFGKRVRCQMNEENDSIYRRYAGRRNLQILAKFERGYERIANKNPNRRGNSDREFQFEIAETTREQSSFLRRCQESGTLQDTREFDCFQISECSTYIREFGS